jgi:hypothetical protein
VATPRRVPEDDAIRAEAAKGHHTQTALAKALGVHRTTLAAHLIANPQLRDDVLAALQGSITADRDELTISQEIPVRETVDVDPDSDQVRVFMRERGIPLDEWVATNVQARRYPIQLGEGRVEEAQYLSVACKRKTGMVVLNVVAAPKPRKVTPVRPRRGEPEVTVLMGCHQVPYHDEAAHELVCGLLAMLEPHRWAHLGDLPDYATASRHKKNQAYAVGVAGTHVESHRILAEMRDASPHSRATLNPGNHDYRLPDFLGQAIPGELAHLAPVGEDDPWWHPRRMLHLEALGIEYIDPVEGMWERARLRLAPSLAAMHGWRTGKAVAARQTAEELGISVICAHTHRQALSRVTTGREELPHLLWAMEVGCLCRLDTGLGYIPGISDWQQGVGVASVWPDGAFHLELAQIVDGAFQFRGQRLSPRVLKVAA